MRLDAGLRALGELDFVIDRASVVSEAVLALDATLRAAALE